MSATAHARHGSRRKMFLRMLISAALVRRGRVVSALAAVVVAAAVTTAVMNLYVDAQAQLRQEFRSYGANVAVVGRNGAPLPPDALTRAERTLGGQGTAVPFAYAVARTTGEAPVVVAGTDLERVRKLNAWWSVSAWPSTVDGALLGVRAAPVVSSDGAPFQLKFGGKAVTLIPAGQLRTGSAEDSRIYLALADFQAWTGVQPSSIEVAVPGTAAEVQATANKLSAALPEADVRALRQMVEGETQVLGKTRSTLLATAVLIILTAALCVLATLTTSVLDRRRDFALMKALGASQALINAFFAAEAAVLGAVGAVLGYAIGIGVAAWIGRVNFHATISPRLSVLPPVLLGSIVVALVAALLPMSLLRRVQPATILRGE